VFHGYGVDILQGLIDGFNDKSDDARQAAMDVARDIARAANAVLFEDASIGSVGSKTSGHRVSNGSSRGLSDAFAHAVSMGYNVAGIAGGGTNNIYVEGSILSEGELLRVIRNARDRGSTI
jgi:hypothetical protein